MVIFIIRCKISLLKYALHLEKKNTSGEYFEPFQGWVMSLCAANFNIVNMMLSFTILLNTDEA